ncbi:MAG TPA: hypothetical protein VF480_05580 [Verrucomicrobiae bacterium]
MSAPAGSTFAWEPLTPRGVAAFARATFSRLLLVQFIVALLAAAAAAWFFDDGCFPTISEAIQKLPADGEIRSGRLDWHGDPSQLLAEGKFLAFDVDLNHSGQIHSTADVQIEFGKDSIRIFSLLPGYSEFFYIPDRVAPFNRTELEPLWGAWAAEILFIAAAGVTVGLLVIWWLLATIYFLPVWLLGFFANRDVNFRECWKLSGAALLPGALLMAAGVLLYDLGFLDLVSLGFVFAAHFALGWIYLFLSQLFLPRISDTPQKGNPFVKK